MSKQQVLLLGATGETGRSILEGLLEDGSFEVGCIVRPSSADRPNTQKLRDRGLKVVVGDLEGSVDSLADVIRGYDVIISAISAENQLPQSNLVEAAAKVGVKRFVPCAFITVAPPGGAMELRDLKEKVYQSLWYHHIPYTIIDVGYWHQISFPRVPSGRLDYASVRQFTEVYDGGNTLNMLTDRRDIGRYVARIIGDERTLNQKVVTYSDALSQNQIFQLIEEKTGEKVETQPVSKEALLKQVEDARAAFAADPTSGIKWIGMISLEYTFSKYVRGDNTPENAKYLGYLDANELYPDFKPIRFAEFVDELIAGKAERLYYNKDWNFSPPKRG